MEKCVSFFYEYRKRRSDHMTQVFNGKDLARYKLERAREELDTLFLRNRPFYYVYM